MKYMQITIDGAKERARAIWELAPFQPFPAHIQFSLSLFLSLSLSLSLLVAVSLSLSLLKGDCT
jgi:hypothetical protein